MVSLLLYEAAHSVTAALIVRTSFFPRMNRSQFSTTFPADTSPTLWNSQNDSNPSSMWRSFKYLREAVIASLGLLEV